MADVLILVGSESDKPRIEPAFDVLSKAGVSYAFHVSSAHRQPGQTAQLVKDARGTGLRGVVAPALPDALLGAAGLGDIGRLFPNTDPRWKDADSLQLLNQAFLKVVEAGHQFVHADITIIAERPKLSPHVDRMEEKLAEALLSAPAHVSVKAKTNEGMGWIGKGEGIAVIAVAVLG